MRIISDIFAYTARSMPKFNSISISGYHMQEAGRDGRPGARLHAGRRRRVRARRHRRGPRHRRVRAAAVVLLGDRHELLHGGRQAARRAPAVGEADRDEFEPKDPRSLALRTHCQTSRLVAHRAGRVQQRRAHRASRRMAATQGAHAVAAHQRARRGARAADRLLAPASPATRSCSSSRRPAPAASSTRGAAATTSSGSPTSWRASALGAHRGGRGAGRHGQGDRGRHPQAAHRGGRRPHAGPHRLAAARRSSASTSSSAERRGQIDVLKVDNSAVRAQQIAKLAAAARPSAIRAAVARGARRRSTERRRGGDGNLLELAVDAARAKATRRRDLRGAGEGVRPPPRRDPRDLRRLPAGGRADAQDVRARAGAWSRPSTRHEGRRPRILVAKMGQDGHDRGQKVIASAFADLGFDVDIGPLFQTPAEAARQAVENDVHVVGVSSLAAGPPHARARAEGRRWRRQGRADIMIVVGGVIPPGDYAALLAAGAEAIFGPGTNIAEAAARPPRQAQRAARLFQTGGGVRRVVVPACPGFGNNPTPNCSASHIANVIISRRSRPKRRL